MTAMATKKARKQVTVYIDMEQYDDLQKPENGDINLSGLTRKALGKELAKRRAGFFYD